MRWARDVTHMGGKVEVHTGYWWGNLRERNNLVDPGVDGRIILTGSSGCGMGKHDEG